MRTQGPVINSQGFFKAVVSPAARPAMPSARATSCVVSNGMLCRESVSVSAVSLVAETWSGRKGSSFKYPRKEAIYNHVCLDLSAYDLTAFMNK